MHIISACSAKKNKSRENIPARDRYTGTGHNYVKNAVDNLRKMGGNITWDIFSAKFGIITENAQIPNYNFTFAGASSAQLFNYATRHPQLAVNLGHSLQKGQLSGSLASLGAAYYRVLHLVPVMSHAWTQYPTVVIASATSATWIPSTVTQFRVETRWYKELKCNKVSLNSRVLQLLITDSNFRDVQQLCHPKVSAVSRLGYLQRRMK